MAHQFVAWFGAPGGGRWLDVGCGTGALTRAVLEKCEPTAVLGIDLSPEFVRTATELLPDPRGHFQVGDVQDLQLPDGVYDAVASGLVLNHVPNPSAAVAEMARVARPGGVVGAYVWDYSGEMQLIRLFWEAVAATDADAAMHDPRSNYHICHPEPLGQTFRAAGLTDLEVSAVDMPMHFRDFDDYWLPHLMTGPSLAQRYVVNLDDEGRDKLREQLRSVLPAAHDGTIPLIARAWAVKAVKT